MDWFKYAIACSSSSIRWLSSEWIFPILTALDVLKIKEPKPKIDPIIPPTRFLRVLSSIEMFRPLWVQSLLSWSIIEISWVDAVRIRFVVGSSAWDIPEEIDALSLNRFDWIDLESITMVIAEFVTKLTVPWFPNRVRLSVESLDDPATSSAIQKRTKFARTTKKALFLNMITTRLIDSFREQIRMMKKSANHLLLFRLLIFRVSAFSAKHHRTREHQHESIIVRERNSFRSRAPAGILGRSRIILG